MIKLRTANFKITVLSFLAAILLAGFFAPAAMAQGLPDEGFVETPEGINFQPEEDFFRGEIIEIVEEEFFGSESNRQLFQTLRIKILTGPEQGDEIVIDRSGGSLINNGKGFKVGDVIVISKITQFGESQYFVMDLYRLPAIIILALIFLVVVVALNRWRGLTSLLGLGLSIAIILYYVVPQIIQGSDPILVSILAASVIAVVSIYLAHGFNARTSVALVSTLVTLALATLTATWAVSFASLFGIGSEEAVYLQVGQTQSLNLRGLLLAGIILGALGVLDDITTAQSAVVHELKKANPAYKFKQLYAGALSVGREHMSSLINTLFLAYAGASLPLFLLFESAGSQPVWTILNAEFLSEEIVRTLAGSMALMIAVPITTALAAYYFSKHQPDPADSTPANLHTH